MSTLNDQLAAYKNVVLLLSTIAIASTSVLLLVVLRLAQILPAPATANGTHVQTSRPRRRRPPPSPSHPTHLLIVLGSGGHTAEMLNILTSIPDLSRQFTRRTYLVSSGDSFSAAKAVEFEKEHAAAGKDHIDNRTENYSVVTVRRARRVHQSFLSTPISTLLSLWDCVAVLRGTHPELGPVNGHTYPDLILTNGPGTGVCVVVASLLLRFFGYNGRIDPSISSRREEGKTCTDQGQMRTIFIESWARVRTLSLSGKILKPLVNRFLVQWPQLADISGDGVEYLGPLVS